MARCGRSASSGLSTDVVRRRGSSASRPQWSNTPAGRNGVGSTSTYPDSASDLPIARRRCCPGVNPRPAGAVGSTDGMTSRPSSRSTSSTRSAGWAISGRQLGRIAVSMSEPGSEVTRAPICVRRRTVAPSGYTTPAIRSGRSTGICTGGGEKSSRGGSPRQSVSPDCAVPLAIPASRVEARSMAATEMAGSTQRS